MFINLIRLTQHISFKVILSSDLEGDARVDNGKTHDEDARSVVSKLRTLNIDIGDLPHTMNSIVVNYKNTKCQDLGAVQELYLFLFLFKVWT